MGSLRRACIRLSLAIVVAGTLATFPAAAEETALVVAADASADAAAIRRHLVVELDSIESPVRVEVFRAGASALRLRIAFADGTLDERELSRGDVPEAEVSRIIALVVAESARAHVHRPPAPAPAETPTPAVAPPPAPAQSLAFGAEATLGARAFDRSRYLAIEPRLAGFVRHASGARMDVGAVYLHSGASDPLGHVSLDGLEGSAAVSLERDIVGSLSARFGPRLDVGAAWGHAAPSKAAHAISTSELLVVATAELALRLRISRIALVVGGDVGGAGTGIGLKADERVPLAWRGLTFAGGGGVSFE